MPRQDTSPAEVEITADTLACNGRWTVGDVAGLRADMSRRPLPDAAVVTIDGAAISAMDTTGAWLLLQFRQQLEADGRKVVLAAFSAAHQRLLDYIAEERRSADKATIRAPGKSWLERWSSMVDDSVDFLAFVGQCVLALLTAIRHPGRIRWRELLDDIYHTGINALPIVGLLSFLMGVVIAYQGAVQLKIYGANIYVADLVGYSMLRELAPLITAIIVSGRIMPIGILPCIHKIHITRWGLKPCLGFKVNLYISTLTFFSRNQHHPIRCTTPINGSGRSIFQNTYRFDIVGV